MEITISDAVDLNINIDISKIQYIHKMSNSTYLSQNNANYIINVLNKFFKEKYNFELNTIINEKFVLYISSKMKSILSNNKDKPLQTLNLQTLSELKDYIKSEFIEKRFDKNIEKKDNYSIEKNFDNNIEKRDNFIENNDDLNIGGEEELEELEIANDDEFMNKIHQLELRRKTFTLPPQTSQTSKSSQDNNNEDIISKNIKPKSFNQSNIPASISTIYMPTPPKIGKEIYINSYDRDWVYEKDRASFRWSKQLPKMQDMLCRVGCFVGSSKLLQKTSYILLNIQGVNGDNQSVSLIPNYTCNNFTIYKPPLDSLGYLKLFSMPWKITLKTGDDKVIDLGSDGDYYEIFETHPFIKDRTSIYVNKVNNYSIGQEIRILTEKNEYVDASVININNTYIEIDKSISEKGYVMNFSEQFSILLELTSGDNNS